MFAYSNKVKSLDLRQTYFVLSKMLQTLSLHWNNKKIYSFKVLEPSILQSFHVVWNPYILNSICHSTACQLDILFIFHEYFPDIAHYIIFP